ncbi:MAG: polyprenyl synthetase family protein [Muribaculaceae bacterium]|nr:polyprenyl synthetase family protein [Muribaculaceae bacterium]
MEFTLDYLSGLVEDSINQIRYPEVAQGLYAPIRYTMGSGGKRLRPALCLAAYSAVTHESPLDVLNQALAIEMFHNFTLLHDDVMDNADVRRGKPTVHRRWGANAAILSGDAMLTLAVMLLAQGADNKLPQFSELFNRTAMEVYQGQQLDMEFEERSDVTVDEYLEMIRLKTSVLLGCACQLGAMAADANDNDCRKFYDYGIALGLAFQLRDDWLDTFGDPVIFGKEIGGDIVNNKKTWLLIQGLAEARDELLPLLEAHLDASDKVEAVTEIYRRLNLDARCNDLVKHYTTEAIRALDGLCLDAEAHSFFCDLALKASTRNH